MKKILVLILSISIFSSLLAFAHNNEWPKTIIDATGKKIVLKSQPKKIAILHSLYLEYFMALGTPPAASAGSSTGTAMKALEEWETLKPYSNGEKIIDLGSARSLNLEAILASNPDVIVTFKGQGHVNELYNQLNEIAPVILLDFSKSWQEQTMDAAKIVGKEEFAKEFIKETEEIIENTRKILSEKNDKTFALFRTDGKSFITRGNEFYYKTFGLKAPENYPYDYKTISLETVAEMNPDYIAFQNYVDLSKTFVKTQESFSVWYLIKAVKNNHIFYFDDSLNTFGPLALRVTAEKLLEIYSK
ncbi:iron complex transport system substrate-binding protein [Oceanotoga teriensis]|uniref:Iron complex transport system substrate-binding protein n=1 Tax=Oceanotoga teriensis TaxID=515440 RepID=A0AA45C7D8_9BACT|nr:ABC transporter substrate-binding protein [Oceanotoga teriensis]PWJ95292.1 iron complex transport system substrate-binding protein [Oceanotoga teriensis]